MLAAVDLGVTNDRQGAGGEQAAQISIASLGDATELLLASDRILLRHESNPGRKISSRSESPRIGNAGHQRRCERRSDARNLVEPLACLI